MNGRRPKTLGNKPSSKSTEPGTNQWLSIPLSDEDVTSLADAKDKLEHLSAGLLSLVSDTVCVSIKFQSERNQYCVSIYRPGRGSGGSVVGLSGFSTDLRDAVLVALYKFHVKLGGQLPERLSDTAYDKPVRRFG
jgi:hypothetical protein